MPRAYHSAVIPAPLDEVWKIVADFGHISDWHPAVRDSRLVRGTSQTKVSAQRAFTLIEEGIEVREELIAMDQRAHTMDFAIVSGQFPIKDPVATIRLNPVGDTGKTFAEWWVRFDADLAKGDEIAESVKNIFFVAGFDALRERFAGNRAPAR